MTDDYGVIICSICGKEENYEDCRCPNDIVMATGWTQTMTGNWVCPDCVPAAEEEEEL
jgi:hypothetical protein